MGRLANRIAFALLLGAALAGCTSTTSPGPAPDVVADVLPPGAAPRHEDWADAVLYFVIVDRFADGDAGNNVAVDPAEQGHFHGGDLAGLRQRLDDIANLGVTAIWLTPVVKNIDGFVTGAGFPDYGYHGYWADDFATVDPRFGSEA